jgi:alkanesulfonate monooxygenase SsuD/methylene tetrahydromethanopterin reductase-like flavin-dependent oxidoreductase (luciferase family)
MASASRIGISMPGLNQPYAKFPELAGLADAAGFDSLWDYEFYRNPFIIHALCARETKSIRLATGLAACAGRTPFEMANAAMDVDEISGGRMILGLGTGGAGWAEFFNGNDVDKPLTRISEYIDVLRMAWQHLATGEPCSYQGKLYRFASPPFNPFGLRRDVARSRIPIYAAGLRPKMLQLAGEKADGLIGYFYTPKFVKDVVAPNIAAGAKRGGRSPSEIDTAALVICSISDDRKEAMRRARINVGLYACGSIGDIVVSHMGLKQDRDAAVNALMTQGLAGLETGVSDELTRAFSIVGTPAECREQYAAYKEVLNHVVLHTPYVPPIGQQDSEEAFRAIIRTFGR